MGPEPSFYVHAGDAGGGYSHVCLRHRLDPHCRGIDFKGAQPRRRPGLSPGRPCHQRRHNGGGQEYIQHPGTGHLPVYDISMLPGHGLFAGSHLQGSGHPGICCGGSGCGGHSP